MIPMGRENRGNLKPETNFFRIFTLMKLLIPTYRPGIAGIMVA
jgi:hypothetical protein